MKKNLSASVKTPITWNCLGDSITDIGYTSKHYFEYINERHPVFEIRNYGISGTRIAGTVSDAMCNRYSEMLNADLITVFGGVNDWGQENPVPLGQIETTDITTFYGALKALCEGLKTKFPASVILFFTPLGCKGFSGFAVEENIWGLTIADYADAIIHVCERYDIPVLDLYRSCGFSVYNPVHNKKYFFDGLHLNEAGHLEISYLIEKAIGKYKDLPSKDIHHPMQ